MFVSGTSRFFDKLFKRRRESGKPGTSKSINNTGRAVPASTGNNNIGKQIDKSKIDRSLIRENPIPIHEPSDKEFKKYESDIYYKSRKAYQNQNLTPRERIKDLYGGDYQLFKKETPHRFLDQYDKHKTFVKWETRKKTPLTDISFWVAPNATVAGLVELFPQASIWYNATVRGYHNLVRIGAFTNVQDGTVISDEFYKLSPGNDGSTMIGHHVTIGHNCTLRACTVEPYCTVGLGSVLSRGSYMETNSILGANSVLLEYDRIPSGQLWVGNPAKYVRDITEKERTQTTRSSYLYWQTALEHREEFRNPHDAHKIAESEGIPVGWKTKDFFLGGGLERN